MTDCTALALRPAPPPEPYVVVWWADGMVYAGPCGTERSFGAALAFARRSTPLPRVTALRLALALTPGT